MMRNPKANGRREIWSKFLELALLVTTVTCIYCICYGAYVYFVSLTFSDVRALKAKGYTPAEALNLLEYYSRAPRNSFVIAGFCIIANIGAGYFKKRLEGKQS